MLRVVLASLDVLPEREAKVGGVVWRLPPFTLQLRPPEYNLMAAPKLLGTSWMCWFVTSVHEAGGVR